MTIEISPEEHAAYEAQASAEGLTVAAWLKKLANERAHLAPDADLPKSPFGSRLVEVCAQVRGLTDDLDFSRNPAASRPIEP